MSRPHSTSSPEPPAPGPWWRDAVFYQIYPRSFADADGDGIGDLAGIRDRLGYIELLGADAIWLNPVMRSPMADHGYDVSDPRDIDPLFGDLDDFDELVREAHARRIRVVMDLVPNHTSSAHPWFAAALAAPPGSRERARYHFRDGRGPDGDEPPNNWPSIFGGPAWTHITDPDPNGQQHQGRPGQQHQGRPGQQHQGRPGQQHQGRPGQWYLHLFAPEQPDLNWGNEEVFDDLERTLRFWLDRGVDGFRIDVAHGMAKPDGLPDHDGWQSNKLLSHFDTDPRFNDPNVHDIHRRIRKIFDEYPHAVAIGEIWVHDPQRFAEYLRPDELHLGFDFHLALTGWDATAIRAAIDGSLAAVAPVQGTPTWTLSNHDVSREVTRFGGGPIGIARARAMILVELALPGAVFVYNGAELGLADVDLPDEALQDPVWTRSGHTDRGRDGCRVPLPWQGDRPPFGFTAATQGWLPQPESWAALTAERQLEDVTSMLSLYRSALELRRRRPELSGGIDWYGSPPGCLAFRRHGGLTCALNTTAVPVPLPPGAVLLASTPGVDTQLPPNSAVWLL